MYTETARVWKVEEYHEVRDEEKFDRLVKNMRRNGWVGRPLVVIDLGNDEYHALTGSHRLAAARKAELDEIPVAIAECDEMWDDYNITVSDLHDEDQIYNLLSEYDEDAAELFNQENQYEE